MAALHKLDAPDSDWAPLLGQKWNRFLTEPEIGRQSLCNVQLLRIVTPHPASRFGSDDFHVFKKKNFHPESFQPTGNYFLSAKAVDMADN